MVQGEHIIKTYLDAIKEAKQSGSDDYEAADIAEQVTLDKHGRLPKEGG